MAKSSKLKEGYIYESPDGGRTVFKRKPNSLEREQIMGPDVENLAEDDSYCIDSGQYQFDFGEHYDGAIKEWTWWDDQTEWADMKKVAKDHPALQAAIDHAIMIYKLSKEDNNNDDDDDFTRSG